MKSLNLLHSNLSNLKNKSGKFWVFEFPNTAREKTFYYGGSWTPRPVLPTLAAIEPPQVNGRARIDHRARRSSSDVQCECVSSRHPSMCESLIELNWFKIKHKFVLVRGEGTESLAQKRCQLVPVSRFIGPTPAAGSLICIWVCTGHPWTWDSQHRGHFPLRWLGLKLGVYCACEHGAGISPVLIFKEYFHVYFFISKFGLH